MDQNQALQKLFELVRDYLAQHPDKVVAFLSPAELHQRLELDSDRPSNDLSVVFSEIENYLKYSVKTNHPQYFNQLWGGFSLPVFMGEVITALCNTSMYTYEVAPVATTLEKKVGQTLLDTIGFPDGEIQMTTGGSNGNLLAMMIARDKGQSRVKAAGMSQSQKPLVAFVSAESHYSYDKAAHILGIGTDQLIKVPVGANGQMDSAVLGELITSAKAAGQQPFFIGATAGTTTRGVFDDITALRSVADEHECWLHVDGAWGGPLIFASDRQKYLKDLEEADSFVLDAHKMMGITLMCSFFAVREKGHFARTFSMGDTSYIFHDEDQVDLGPLSIQCGRRNDVLKFWLEWCYVGEKGFTARIDRFLSLVNYAQAKVENEPSLELRAADSPLNVCFRCVGQSDVFNVKVREQLREKGISLVNYGYLEGEAVIRLVLANQAVTKADIDQFFQNFIMEANALHENY